MNEKQTYDLIVVGAGACGLFGAIFAARKKKKVLLLEKLPQIARKLKASGGGRCNLTNTLSNEDFMKGFGRDGRFMQDALKEFDHQKLREYFHSIGVETDALDGLRVFPATHSSNTVIEALQKELEKYDVTVVCNAQVTQIITQNQKIAGVKTKEIEYKTKHLLLATGALGYPTLGSEGDGYKLAHSLGHTTTELFPAMMPLKTKEQWVERCRADTIAKVTLKIAMKKHKKLKATGDLIFTKNGIRGPVVLDFAREITPLLTKYNSLDILLNFTKGRNEEQIRQALEIAHKNAPSNSTLQHIQTLLPLSLAQEIAQLANVDATLPLNKLSGATKAKLYSLLSWTPLTIVGHDGFDKAMITRGGISLKEIDPKTMQSKLIDSLYFCGELLNLDGPCGGYNLQWAFSSGVLSAKLL
jgi:hypothetical protein